ncbi:hypothetical protein [Halomarina rubra]|uniref:Dolichyl-phosphate-mannose-protein mannosyltransferase n=1 Tax=Halomarina rubra TaxID=2071873 RepID=A0ABD6B192_9EURY|nr:hypothetical protein [Halomarina rubra]
MKYEDTRRRRRSKLLLIVGFLALTFAIVRAHLAPAQGYELSIYGATPATVWLGVAIALVVSVAVTALRPKGWLVPAALGLAIFATALVVFMPTVRGYFGYGQHDAMTHLGWARGIITGEMEAMDIFYPGGHSAVGLIHTITGISVPRSMMLLVQLLALGYLVFVPLIVRTLVDDLAGTAIAVFAACLLLPVTNISTYLDFHPYTMTTFFFTVILFLLFEYLSRHSRGLANGLTATGLLLLLSTTAAVLFHGQVALNVLILFATIALVQKLYRWLPGGSVFADARSLAMPTVLFGAFYVLWASRYQIVYTMFGKVYDAVAKYVEGQNSPGQGIQSQTDSASSIGVSIVELFMKLFFVKAVFVALGAILVLVALAGRLDDESGERNEAITYFAYGGLVLGPFFLAHFLGSISRYFFRHVGFAMVIATLLGIVMMHSFYRAVAGGKYERSVRTIGAVAILGALLLSLLVVFPSPYIYLSSSGVPQQMHDGYDTAFEYNETDMRWNGIRGAPGRYEDGLRGPSIFPWGEIDEQNLLADNLTTHSPYPYYFAVSEFDRQREIGAYRGATFSEEALNSITDEDDVSKVFSTGELTIYYVDSSNPPEQQDQGGDDGAAGEGTGGEDAGGGDAGEGEGGGDAQSTEAPSSGTSTPIPVVTPEPTATPAPTGGTDTGGDTGGGEAGDGTGGEAGDGTDGGTDAGAGNETGGDTGGETSTPTGGDTGGGTDTPTGGDTGGTQTGTGGNTSASVGFVVPPRVFG